MAITYKTNGVPTTKSLTEWYFGKATVQNFAQTAQRQHEQTGKRSFKFWQNGTGYLTIEIN